jgi:hypothetical protein
VAAAQLLDFMIFQLAQLDKRSQKDLARAMRQVEGDAEAAVARRREAARCRCRPA